MDEKDKKIEELEAKLIEKDQKFADYEAKITQRDDRARQVLVENAFSNSSFVERLQGPVDMIKNYFSHYFKAEDGLLTGYINGNKINSRKNPGNTASFEEAIEIIVNQLPEKHKLLPRDDSGSGGSSAGGSSAGGGGKGKLTGEQIKDMSLPEYEKAKKEGRVPGIVK